MSYSQPIGSPGEQLQAIHAMLAAGHRSVHLERHSLLLIGAVGGFLSVVSEWAITPERFPDATERGFALLVWLAFWLGGVSLLDHWLTRRARARRAETLPFAQTQITRAWWMLLSVGCLGSFAMSFYGGGSMIYALWTVLLGLGIYLFGLFSQRLIEWIGLATILLGITGLAAGVSYETTRWLNASCFAVGMPLAGWMAAKFLTRRGCNAPWPWLYGLPSSSRRPWSSRLQTTQKIRRELPWHRNPLRPCRASASCNCIPVRGYRCG